MSEREISRFAADSEDRLRRIAEAVERREAARRRVAAAQRDLEIAQGILVDTARWLERILREEERSLQEERHLHDNT